MNHFYYLHTNGELIHKRFEPEGDSTFVRKVWCLDTEDRGSAWTMLVEAAARGANKTRVQELRSKWGLTDIDGQEFCSRAGLHTLKQGETWTVTFKDPEVKDFGQGESLFNALVDLCHKGL